MIRIYKILVPGNAIALFLVDAVLVVCCYSVAAFQNLPNAGYYLLSDDGRAGLAWILATLLAGLYLSNLYEDYLSRSRIQLVQRTMVVLGLGFLAEALLNYANLPALPKWTMIYGSLYLLISFVVWRRAFSVVSQNAVGSQRLLFLGRSPTAQEVISQLTERPELGFTPLGFLDDAGTPEFLGAVRRIGSMADLAAVVEAEHPAAIIVGRKNFPAEQLLEMRMAGSQVDDASASYELILRRVPCIELDPPRLLSLALHQPARDFSAGLGRAAALLALVPLLPVFGVIAIILRLTSGGPVLVRTRRVGLGGTPFEMFEFRAAGMESHWLRGSRLSGLPQLINVARAEMALVGPAPLRPEFAATLAQRIPPYTERHSVKPGMTGWAQIHQGGRSAAAESTETLEYDLYYIKNQAAWLDLFVLISEARGILSSLR